MISSSGLRLRALSVMNTLAASFDSTVASVRARMTPAACNAASSVASARMHR